MIKNKTLNYLLIILIIISFYILPFGSLDFKFCICVLLIFTLISLLIIINNKYIGLAAQAKSIIFKFSNNMLISLNLLKNNLKEVYNLSYIKKNKNYLYIIMFFIIMVLAFNFVSDEQKGFLVGFSISFWLYIISHNLFNKSGIGFVSFIKLFLIRAAKLVIAITLIVLILYSLIYFNLLDSLIVYCQGGDEITASSSTEILEQVNKNIGSAITQENKEDTHYHLNKKLVDTLVDKVDKVADTIIGKAIPTLGGYGAGGVIAAATLKHLPNTMSVASRVGSSFAAAGAGAASIKLGLGISDAILEQTGIKKELKSHINDSIARSAYSEPNINRIPSPGNEFIPSLLDTNELLSPLEKLLNYQLTINFLIFILITSLLIIIFNKFVVKYNYDLINKYVGKYMSIKFKERFDKYVNKSNELNNRFILVIFVINCILLFYFMILNIYVSSELTMNIDDYIQVYNHLKKS